MNRRLLVFIAAAVWLAMALPAAAAPVPEEAQRHFARGMAAVELAKTPEDYVPAIREFEQAQALAPGWPDVCYNLGLVQYKAGRFGAAAASLKHYLQLVPEAPDSREIQQLVYKLEYQAEQVLSVTDIVEALVSFYQWPVVHQENPRNQGWSYILNYHRRDGDNAIEALVNMDYYAGGTNQIAYLYQTIKVTGPTISYAAAVDQCGSKSKDSCPVLIKTEVTVVSRTDVILHQETRGSFGTIHYSCEYRKAE